MSIFAALCVHIHNRAKDGQSLNTGHNMDKYRQFGQPPHIEEVTSHPPDMDNVDNLTQTHRPRADVSTPETAVFKAKSPFYAAGGQSLNTARPNMDNVDNRTQTRPPLCVRIRPVVCVVSTTGQKPETDERRAFSFGRVLAVFVKCRNTTDKTDICPPFRLYFGYI